jgi:hypothetical protein
MSGSNHEAQSNKSAEVPDPGQVDARSISSEDEPQPDPDVKVPKYQYLTEGFDPDRIPERKI